MSNNMAKIRRSSTHVQSIIRRICRKSEDQSFRLWKQLPHRHFIHHKILKHSNKPIKHLISHTQIVKDKYFKDILNNNNGNITQQQLYHNYLNHINQLFIYCHHLNNMLLYKYGRIPLFELNKYNKSNLLHTKHYNR
eukprot:365433_1